ncbi:MAG TPA: EamA family transporter RarD [Syntrophomonadaceae bacterium]|jgi:chloramphenicol-sensitive protein RarD|nr:EamA family transporter RarD [Syntrophomonadaceae bacterium]
MQTLKSDRSAGVGYAVGAYLLWGILPVYWKLLQHVPPMQILAHRISWAFAFLLSLLLITGKFAGFWRETMQIARQPRKLAAVCVAAITLNINWGTYIWAVNNNHIVQTSLGYYINPLVSVLLGILILKERLSLWQLAAFVLAGIGVFSLTLQFGAFPWIAILLALTFGLYGLFKKTVDIGSITGLTLETLLTCSFALPYLAYVSHIGSSQFGFNLSSTSLLLIGAGAVTATPLVLFSAGTKRLPLYVVGFLQYISPTIALLLGVLVYHEPFTQGHLLSFAVIWLGLLLFSLSKTKPFIKMEEKIVQPSVGV